MTNIEMETLSLVKSACRKYIVVEIDWEQRRYEIARDLYVQFPTMSVVEAVEHADLLIEELKKKK